METFRSAHQAHTRTSHLTKLYSDTKKSALYSLNVYPSQATLQDPSLKRKLRIQKDRLITWGLAWSDDDKSGESNIDDAVAKAGLAETVESVLNNVREVLEEAQRYQPSGLAGKGSGDKLGTDAKPALTFDVARYEDLLKDLTTSIDTLYDLSRSRRALARGEHPSFNESSTEKSNSEKATSIKKSTFGAPSFASSEITLVNPSFQRPVLSPYAGLPPRIELTALRLPEEGPPPYEAIGVPTTTRLVAKLIRAKVSELVQDSLGSNAAEVPVLVEFANFDSIYRDTHVPPPLQRLEALAGFLQPMRPDSQVNLSLLGYIEDPSQPRIGLVYDVPYAIQNRLQATAEHDAQTLDPVSLLKLVQKASKTQQPNGDIVVPALEDRFRLALSLVEQLCSLHAHGLAHGNINSNSVIFTTTSFDKSHRLKHMMSPLWASFDLFSKSNVEGHSRAVNLNIYRHPEDHPHGRERSLSEDIKYDLYGLALVLIEIGLWTPVGDLYKPKYSIPDFKLRLEKLWAPKLAARCGTPYMRVVEACLNVTVAQLDDADVYGLLINKLRTCCLMGEDETSARSASIFEGSSFVVQKKATQRKDQPTADPTSLSRQVSETGELLRTQSVSTLSSVLPHRLPSMTSIADAAPPRAMASVLPSSPPHVSRQPSVRSQLSHRQSFSQMKERVSRAFAPTPSFKEYKRKIVLIQKTWRERCEAHHHARSQSNNKIAPPSDELRDIVEAPDERLSRPKRKEFPMKKLPQALIEDWHNNKCFQLADLVERALKGSPESSSIVMTAYGETLETAKPTFLICCKSTAKVKQVLKRHFKYDPAVYDIRVKKDEIRRCRRSRRRGEDDEVRRSMAPASALDKAANPGWQERPLCGASIGAYRDEEHLPPVSFGGIVLVDGQAYGMSVHHMLEPEDDEDDEQAEPGAEDDDSDTSSVGSAENVSIYSHSDDESTVRPPSTIADATPSDDHDGDMPGITPDDYEDIPITQPALDDAIDCDLHVEEDEEDDDEDSGIDEDHLLSYKLGQVHASSGLKRSTVTHQEGFKSISHSLPQEIDWALFELTPPRVHPFNVVQGGTKFCNTSSSSNGGNTFPIAVRDSSELACAPVHCIGRTSGLASGVISSTMELVKIHGRSTFSASWAVDGEFGVGGDSGAWVIGNDDGKVCGHVLASRRGRTYICPMDLLLEDIRQTLGASSVSLPPVAAKKSAVKKEDARASSEERERAVTAAVSKMRLAAAAEGEGGGVALPASPTRRSMSRTTAAFAHVAEPVRTAG